MSEKKIDVTFSVLDLREALSEPTAGTDAETVVEDEPDAIFRPRRNQQIEPELH